MPRFFAEASDFSEGAVVIKGDDARHIARSLRMAVGDEVTVCDKDGCEHLCRLTLIRDELCECKILSSEKSVAESPVEISLFIAYPKGDKLEFVIQKAVELGASRIVPFESSRCIKKPHPEKAERQNARLSKIAEEAAKQCGRAKVPSVALPHSYGAALKEAAKSELALFCYEGNGTESLKTLLEKSSYARTVSVVVGAEGGFSSEEFSMAKEAGLLPANLGPRILRCETAPLYVLSAISYFKEL